MVTEPSCRSRAGRPSPATPYWKLHDRSESNWVSWRVTCSISAGAEPPAATACAALLIPSR